MLFERAVGEPVFSEGNQTSSKKGREPSEKVEEWVHLSVTNGDLASLIAQLVKNPPAMQETPVQFLGWEDPWVRRRDRLPTPVFLGFPGGSSGK